MSQASTAAMIASGIVFVPAEPTSSAPSSAPVKGVRSAAAAAAATPAATPAVIEKPENAIVISTPTATPRNSDGNTGPPRKPAPIESA